MKEEVSGILSGPGTWLHNVGGAGEAGHGRGDPLHRRATGRHARDPAQRHAVSSSPRSLARASPVMPAILLTVMLSNGAVEGLRTLAPILADQLGRPEVAGVVIRG